MMIFLVLGYPAMLAIFLIFRFFYHILSKGFSHKILTRALKDDLTNLYADIKKLVWPKHQTFKIIIVMMVFLCIRQLLPPQNTLIGIAEYALSMIMFLLLAVVFLPPEIPSHRRFPMEIFGFIYSVIFMFYSGGSLVFATFDTVTFFREDMWIYGYAITMLSYVICIATLRRFMERKLSKEEIVLLGMIILIALEFITYYGIGFFGGLQWYNPEAFETNIFGDMTAIINQGIFMASQSQIMERSTAEIWGNIILNGTDVLTLTAVLGYMLQKIMDNKDK